MTVQIGEKLIYNETEFFMASYPLNPYLKMRPDIQFKGRLTLNHRGYRGSWKIEDNKLHLIDLSGTILETIHNENNNYLTTNFKNVSLNYLFPGNETVFAEWFTGVIRIPQGEVLKYVHHGYGTIYEKDLFLRLEDGILIDKHEKDNRMFLKRQIEKLTTIKLFGRRTEKVTPNKAQIKNRTLFWRKYFGK